MNTLATFFASIIALFSGLLGHSSSPTIIQQPVTEDTHIVEVSTSTVIKNETNSTSQISTTIENWQEYHYSKYGLSFKYPSFFSKVIINDDNSISIPPPDIKNDNQENSGLKISIIPFTTTFNVAMDSYKLHYNTQTNTWMKNTEDGGPQDSDTYPKKYSPTCEKVFTIGTQKLSSYAVGYKHPLKYALILKQGILFIEEVPEEEPVPPQAREIFNKILDSFTLDNPSENIKVVCNQE